MSNANDKIAAQRNIKQLGDSMRYAIEHLHSREIDRQMAYRGTADTSVHQHNTDVIQCAFNAALKAFEEVRKQAARLGVEIEDCEF